ncbi:MAG: hypothetical protein GXO61_04690 [Epsilonproteobacteria bacterium]|nr:hypothetical protein [Campylobacterota bacterium]
MEKVLKTLLALLLANSLTVAKEAQTLGVYNPNWEILEIIRSKEPLEEKLIKIKKILKKDPISPNTARELLRFLEKNAPKKIKDIERYIFIQEEGLA